MGIMNSNRGPGKKNVDLKLNKTGLGDRSGVNFSELVPPPPPDGNCTPTGIVKMSYDFVLKKTTFLVLSPPNSSFN